MFTEQPWCTCIWKSEAMIKPNGGAQACRKCQLSYLAWAFAEITEVLYVEKSYVRLCSSSHFSSSEQTKLVVVLQNSQWPPQQRMSIALFLFIADSLISIASRVLRSVTLMEHST